MGEPPILDLRHLRCPLPVLKARKRLTGMASGEQLAILTTDPLARLDIPAFLAEAGHRLVERTGDGDGDRFVVECGSKA